MKDLSKKIVEAEFLPLDPYRATKEEVLSEDTFRYLNAIENEFFKESILLKVRDIAKNLGVKDEFNRLYKAYNKEYGKDNEQANYKKYKNRFSKNISNDFNKTSNNGESSKIAIEENLVNFEDCPIDNLAAGIWNASDDGIWKIENRNFEPVKVMACPHPILPVERLKNVESGLEKVRLSFHRDNIWEDVVVDNSLISNRSSIISLADRGIQVNSNNAGTLISYLSDILSLNNKKIPVTKSINRLGWVDNNFVPFVDNYKYDGDISFKSVYESIKTQGDYEVWKEHVKELRSKSKILKILMAASFASPLIEILGTLPFIVHLWGGTDTRKTVATMVAMSIWGNPSIGKLIKTLNSTVLAMSRYATFMHNLPVAYDELQIVRSKYKSFDEIIMQLAEGIDRGLGRADGGIQTQGTWRNIFLFTGEEPVTKEYSGGGAKNRVLEIEATTKIIADGVLTANLVKSNYGHASRDFIDNLPSKEEIIKRYSEILKEVNSTTELKDKQAAAVATVLLGDELSNRIFSDDLLTIEDIIEVLPKENNVDLAERAYNVINDWIGQNINKFKNNDNNEIYGKINTVRGECFVIKSILIDMLEERNISFDGIKARLVEKGFLFRDNRNKYTQRVRVNGILTNCIKLKLYEKDDDNFFNEIVEDNVPF